MQASMVHACAPVASLVAPRAVAKSTVVAKTSAPFGSALRVKPSASARGVAIQASAAPKAGSTFASNSGLKQAVARQTVLKSHASCTVVKCNAEAAEERCA